MNVWGQPMAMNGKLYMRGMNSKTFTVFVYTPDQDHWDDLTPLPVYYFTVATLRGQLLVVGGIDECTHKRTNTILTFDESSQRWLQSLPLMPVAVSFPAVVEYQDYLIIAGGYDSSDAKTTDVNILDIIANKWTTAEPLPNTDDFNPCLIGDTLYLVGEVVKQVFRANVPSLISQVSSSVWESVTSVPWCHSSLVTVNKTLLILGGRNTPSLSGTKTANIHLYDPTKDQWTKCGNLPKPMICYCIELSDKLYVFERFSPSSVYVSTLFIARLM